MHPTDDEFIKLLHDTFRIEAEDHFAAMSSGLIALENAADPDVRRTTLETVFREAHSLKGAARAVGIATVENLCQAMENFFAALKRDQRQPDADEFTALHRTLDRIKELISSTDATGTISDLVGALSAMEAKLVHGGHPETPAHAPTAGEKEAGGESQAVATATNDDATRTSANGAAAPSSNASAEPSRDARDEPSSKTTVYQVPPSDVTVAEAGPFTPGQIRQLGSPRREAPEMVRLTAAKLNSILRQTEELIYLKLTAARRAAESEEIAIATANLVKEWGLYGNPARLAEATTGNRAVASDFLERTTESLHHLQSLARRVARTAKQERSTTAGMVNLLMKDAKTLLLVPFSSLLISFPKLVRDLSHDLGKNVHLSVQGEEIEVDKRILDALKDPLIHLARNCIDHGIESPEERRRKAKPEAGALKIIVSQPTADKVELTIADDGAGIDAHQVRTSAIHHGLLSPEKSKEVSDAEVLRFIFQSEISTSSVVTNVSGRGLGLAIVHQAVERLRGTISVETKRGVRTVFKIALPSAIATFRGVLVTVCGCSFIVPTNAVLRVLRVRPDEIATIENKDVIDVDGQSISYYYLGDVLEVGAPSGAERRFVPVLVMGGGERSVAFGVDDILYEQEVLVKNLGCLLLRVSNISGAAILGSGEVVPIINAVDLIRSALKLRKTISSPAQEPVEKKTQSILVVEDSITSRTLLKGTLEAAGYRVSTAVDGIDGFAALRAGEFDIVLSDVEMPRMNGFDLIAKMRSDPRYKELPAVLITSLDSREDRERGIDVGANAYMVKSRYDQDNLLQIIRRLI